MKTRLGLAGAAFVLALLVVGLASTRTPVSHASQAQTMSSYHQAPGEPQTAESPAPATGEDQKVPVQLWTVLAAGAAGAVFLLLFMARVALGRVQPPPPQEEAAHH